MQKVDGGDADYRLHISSSPGRSNARKLKTPAVASRHVYIFVDPPDGIEQVRFYMDLSDADLEDPAISAAAHLTDSKKPFDFNGSQSNARARGYDTRQLPDGSHTVTAALDLEDGSTVVLVQHQAIFLGMGMCS